MVGPPWRSCSPSPRRRPPMGEWDGLEARLKDLGDEAARLVDDPLDPARVRRLADRRRLRRSVAAVADRGGHPRLRRGRRVRGHVPTGAAHTEPGRRSHQHADPESRAVGGDQRSRGEDPERHVRARRSATGSTDLPVEQPVLTRSHLGVTDAVGDPLPVAVRDIRGARAGADVHLDGGSGCAPDLGTDQWGRGWRRVDADRPAAERRDRRRLTPAAALRAAS